MTMVEDQPPAAPPHEAPLVVRLAVATLAALGVRRPRRSRPIVIVAAGVLGYALFHLTGAPLSAPR